MENAALSCASANGHLATVAALCERGHVIDPIFAASTGAATSLQHPHARHLQASHAVTQSHAAPARTPGSPPPTSLPPDSPPPDVQTDSPPPPPPPPPASDQSSSQRTRGMLIMFLGVVAISPDAMFVRFMQAEAAGGASGGAAGADADLQITFWKYLLFWPMHLAVTLWHYGGYAALARRFRAGPGHILAAGACQLCISVSLNLAYTNTVAARAHLFFALNPLWAVLFSRFFLKDVVPARTVVALFLASAAVLVVFLPNIIPSLGGGNNSSSSGSSSDYNATTGSLASTITDATSAAITINSSSAVAAGSRAAPTSAARASRPVATVHGDLLAILAGAALGAMIVVSASAKRQCPDAAMLSSVLFGSAGVVVVSFLWQLCAGRPSMTTISLAFGGIALVDGICVCIVYVATIVAPRYASSAEVALLNPLEAVLGPIFV